VSKNFGLRILDFGFRVGDRLLRNKPGKKLELEQISQN
jgi:hypothetical protein